MTHNQKTEKLKKEKVLCILSGILLLIGIVTLLYPSVSSYLAKKQQEQVIIGYEQTIAATDEEKLAEEWEKAVLYNQNPDSMVYEDVLNLDGSGVMGYIVIPQIGIRLPIYHGAEEESLKKGVGHVKETSLPVGGEGTHAVLTGHRGMPGAELFTRLDEVNIGDVFYIHILDRVLAYKVEEIQIVLPEEVSKLVPEKGADLVTLVTCTPYGVNTHRLLVRGQRTIAVENTEEKEVFRAKAVESKWMQEYKRDLCISFALFGTAMILFLIVRGIQKHRKEDKTI